MESESVHPGDIPSTQSNDSDINIDESHLGSMCKLEDYAIDKFENTQKSSESNSYPIKVENILWEPSYAQNDTLGYEEHNISMPLIHGFEFKTENDYRSEETSSILDISHSNRFTAHIQEGCKAPSLENDSESGKEGESTYLELKTVPYVTYPRTLFDEMDPHFSNDATSSVKAISEASDDTSSFCEETGFYTSHTPEEAVFPIVKQSDLDSQYILPDLDQSLDRMRSKCESNKPSLRNDGTHNVQRKILSTADVQVCRKVGIEPKLTEDGKSQGNLTTNGLIINNQPNTLAELRGSAQALSSRVSLPALATRTSSQMVSKKELALKILERWKLINPISVTQEQLSANFFACRLKTRLASRLPPVHMRPTFEDLVHFHSNKLEGTESFSSNVPTPQANQPCEVAPEMEDTSCRLSSNTITKTAQPSRKTWGRTSSRNIPNAKPKMPKKVSSCGLDVKSECELALQQLQQLTERAIQRKRRSGATISTPHKKLGEIRRKQRNGDRDSVYSGVNNFLQTTDLTDWNSVDKALCCCVVDLLLQTTDLMDQESMDRVICYFGVDLFLQSDDSMNTEYEAGALIFYQQFLLQFYSGKWAGSPSYF
uniref:(California timema) hypothetical protein n=1 Tax=Timema californicum TaxID=61474 RepID=A0A7R9JBH1_TIMCA|nr:unnamed protein product [Timema californicum]